MSVFWGPLGFLAVDLVTTGTCFGVPKGYLCPHVRVTRPERWWWLPKVPMATGRVKGIPDICVLGSFGVPGSGFGDTQHPFRCPQGLLVSPLVGDEAGALAETLAAARAGEGLLPGVDAAVSGQVRSNGEGFAALGAGVGPLASVTTPVQSQR